MSTAPGRQKQSIPPDRQQQSLESIASTAMEALDLKAKGELAVKYLTEVLRARGLTEERIQALKVLVETLVENFEQKSPSAQSPTAIKALAPQAQAIIDAGGIFIGKEELVELGRLESGTEIPPIPEKFGLQFLQSEHPLRGGSIASHVILAFDPDPKNAAWHCIDRGTGGESDIVPGYLGQDGGRLSAYEQDKLVENVNVEGCNLRAPRDSYPVERILNNAVALHLRKEGSIEGAPFRGIWGRTADTERGAVGCRVLVGFSDEDGTVVHDFYPSDFAGNDLGLLACWN